MPANRSFVWICQRAQGLILLVDPPPKSQAQDVKWSRMCTGWELWENERKRNEEGQPWCDRREPSLSHILQDRTLRWMRGHKQNRQEESNEKRMEKKERMERGNLEKKMKERCNHVEVHTQSMWERKNRRGWHWHDFNSTCGVRPVGATAAEAVEDAKITDKKRERTERATRTKGAGRRGRALLTWFQIDTRGTINRGHSSRRGRGSSSSRNRSLCNGRRRNKFISISSFLCTRRCDRSRRSGRLQTKRTKEQMNKKQIKVSSCQMDDREANSNAQKQRQWKKKRDKRRMSATAWNREFSLLSVSAWIKGKANKNTQRWL